MAISRSKQFIFIKLNKTGGTSVQQQLATVLPDLERDGHRLLSDYDVDLDHYFKFAFVRNPWDKMVSFYSYHAGRGFDLLPPKRSGLFASLSRFVGARERPSFRAFILEDMQRIQFTKQKGKSSRLMRTSNQLDWLSDAEGQIRMDFIGRFESLQDDFAHVCSELGLPPMQLSHINRSQRARDYRRYYDDDTYRAVTNAFKKDIDYFGYHFGE